MKPGTDRHLPMVMKFGGSCFLDLNDYAVVAHFIASRLSEARRILVVASAMSGMTGNLRKTLQGLHQVPPPVLTAQLLTTGDTVSAILLATALAGLGVRALVLDAREEGMFAAGSPEHAYLTDIDPAPLWSALAACQVVVIAGGQAVDADNNVVMLGRNSSDLSAVAAAVAINAVSCEIFSDVPGVFTADPYLLPEARLIGELGYPTALAMSRSGAKVLHPLAVELAARNEMPIICRTRPPEANRGTVIAANGSPVVIIADVRSAVWAFPNVAALEAARERLTDIEENDAGLDVVVADYEGIRHLVVPGGDPYETAARVCAAADARPELRLLTTIHDGYVPERLLVLQADLIPEARRRHNLHYPPPASRPDTKQRSALSNLLTGHLSGVAPSHAAAPAGLPATAQHPVPDTSADGGRDACA